MDSDGVERWVSDAMSTPEERELDAQALELAKVLRRMYTSYMLVGFEPEVAIKILAEFIRGSLATAAGASGGS